MLWPMLPGHATEAWETWGAIATQEEKTAVQKSIASVRATIDNTDVSRIGVTLGVMLTLAQALEHLVDSNEIHWNTLGMNK